MKRLGNLLKGCWQEVKSLWLKLRKKHKEEARAEACPVCGCKERIVQQTIRDLKQEGKLSEKAFPQEAMALQVPLIDMTKPPLVPFLTIPVLIINFDVCKECKAIYCVGVQLLEQPAQVQIRGPQLQRPPTDASGGKLFPY